MKRQRILFYLLLALAAGVFLFSAYQLYLYWQESAASQDINRRMTDLAVESVSEPQADREEPDAAEHYAPISVDFDALWEQNSDITAWIYCPDTPINLPIVQAEDNDYYLRRLLNGNWNMSGTLFMDFRNASDFSDWNSVVYGHNMKNDTMFGTLPRYREQAYYEAHPVIYLLTPETDYKVELLAGFMTQSASDVYTIPMTQEQKDELLADSLFKSDFTASAQADAQDRLLILSTCSYEYNNARYVLVGAMRPLERPKDSAS